MKTRSRAPQEKKITRAEWHRLAQGFAYGKPLEERIKPGRVVTLYGVSADEKEVVELGNAIACADENDKTSLDRKLDETTSLPQSEAMDFIICTSFRPSFKIRSTQPMPIVRIPFSYPGIGEDVMPSIMNNYDIDQMFIWDTRAMRLSGVPQTTDFQLWRADKKQEKKKLLAEDQAKKDTGNSSTDNSKNTGPGKTTRRTPKDTSLNNDKPNSPPGDEIIDKGSSRKNKGTLPTKPVIQGDPLLDQPSNDDDEADEEESPICGTTAVEIERYGRELYEHRRILVYLDDLMTESESRRLRPISEEHVAKTIQMFKEFGTQEMYGSISVTVHPEYFPESGDIEDVLEFSCDDGDHAKAKITFIIIDGAHRFVALNRLREDANPLYDWTRRRIPVYLTYRRDGKPLTQLEKLKNGQLLNTVSAHSLPTVEFLDEVEQPNMPTT